MAEDRTRPHQSKSCLFDYFIHKESEWLINCPFIIYNRITILPRIYRHLCWDSNYVTILKKEMWRPYLRHSMYSTMPLLSMGIESSCWFGSGSTHLWWQTDETYCSIQLALLIFLMLKIIINWNSRENRKEKAPYIDVSFNCFPSIRLRNYCISNFGQSARHGLLFCLVILTSFFSSSM